VDLSGGSMRVADLAPAIAGETVTKSAREIMEILESYDLTRCAHSAAQLAGCDAKTVRRYVALRDAGGGDPLVRASAPRPKLIDAFLPKVEELVDVSKAKIRADKVHERLVAMGFTGTERTTRRAVREAKIAWRAGRRRTYRPWMPEPGLWLQFDWGDGPRIGGRKTYLFCAWLAWSRFRVVIPVFDQTMGTLIACLDATLRPIGACRRICWVTTPRRSPSTTSPASPCGIRPWWLPGGITGRPCTRVSRSTRSPRVGLRRRSG
jgi:hypothetical protein